MKTVHAGLGITESDWQLTVKHLTATLDKFKVADKERNAQAVLEPEKRYRREVNLIDAITYSYPPRCGAAPPQGCRGA